jgi:hypothetical protein
MFKPGVCPGEKKTLLLPESISLLAAGWRHARQHGYSNPTLVVNWFFGIRSQPPEGGTTANVGLL